METIDFSKTFWEEFGLWSYIIIPIIIGILSSVFSELFYKYLPVSNLTKKHNLIFLFNVIFSVSTMMMFHTFYSSIWMIIGSFIGNYFVSLLFYFTLGKRIVMQSVKKGKHKIDEILK